MDLEVAALETQKENQTQEGNMNFQSDMQRGTVTVL